ncbi:MAG: lytic transglycosylase domain-containing protein, partial [Rubrobacter sp.]|nr:lytic transglycosylase domain-containing protein [Rubrobacter sp.]
VSSRGVVKSPNEDGKTRENTSPRPGKKPDSGQSVSPSRDESKQTSRSNAFQSTGEPEIDQDRTVQSPTVQRRVRQLEAQERAGEIPRAATGYSAERRPQELRIAREEIVAEPVDKAELRRYKELYERAAEDYGFGEDWYILAAVGKVESDHGRNMGPSSAGALGPMQFMPSTWQAYGIDANGDGEANIMDPEDAIPSAAKYLKAGGAPDDWYEALFTYNHAGWYVEDVLEVAEGYRQAAGDEEIEPYYLEDR